MPAQALYEEGQFHYKESNMDTPDSPSIEQLQTEKKALLALLGRTRVYVSCAYECAFPDEFANAQLLAEVEAALAGNITDDQG
jgi:hypothetical protein